MRFRSYIIRDELNGAQAMRFAETLGNCADDLDAVELSLRHASGIDVTGLAILVRLYSQLRANRRTLVITDAPKHVRQTLAELGLEYMLTDRQPVRRTFQLPTLRRRTALA